MSDPSYPPRKLVVQWVQECSTQSTKYAETLGDDFGAELVRRWAAINRARRALTEIVLICSRQEAPGAKDEIIVIASEALDATKEPGDFTAAGDRR
jgi:hypothetical protein